MIRQIELERLEIAEGAFRTHEARPPQLARRKVGEDQQCARIAAILNRPDALKKTT